jgi:serine/threonine protein kinase
MLPSMLHGLSRMIQQGYVHLDIKPANILYNQNDNKLYLIDFGLISSLKHIKSEEGILSHNYLYYPPEFKILAYKKQNVKMTPEKIKRSILRNILNEFFVKKFSKYGYNLNDAVKFFLQDDLSNFDKWATTIDSYGLGMTFIELYYILYLRRSNRYRNRAFVKEALKTVIIPMISLNPEKRINAKQAYNTLTKLIQKYPKSTSQSQNNNTWLKRAMAKFSETLRR